MNVPKGKPSTSPPVQISQQPNRNIVPAPPRGQTPPIRQDFTVDPQSGYSYQTGFAVSAAAHPHEMSKQTVTSGGLPQPGLTPQTSIYSTNPRPFYPGQQQQMRQPRPQFMNNMPGQAPMYQQMVYVSPSNAYPNQAGQIMYQPQNVMYGQRMPQQYATIPNNVQQPFQQYPANQAYASGTQQSYPLYYQQQPQQQTPAIPVGPIAQSRPASVPNQTAPPKRERNPITIVDPTTKKDVTDEILHHKSTPPSSTGTPVSFPISTSPPQQQNEICAQFASQVAATLRSQPSKHSSNSSDGMASPHVSDSTQGSTTPEPNPIQHSNEMQQNQQHSINMASGDVIKGETSVDPPSFIPDSSVKSNQHQKDPVVFEANEYNVNVSNMQKEATASKAAVVSANLDNLPEKEVPPSKSEPVSIPSQPQKNNIDIKLGSISAQNTTESKPKSSNEVTESVPKSQKIPVTVSVKNSSPPPAFTKDIKKPKSEGSVEKAEVAPTKSKTSVPTPGPQMAVDKKEESVKSTPQEPKLQSPKLQSPVAAEKEVEEIKQTVKEEVKESGPSTTEQEKEPRDNTSPLDNKTIPELTPPTKTEANESVIKEEPVAPPVSVSTDNKNETIPQVEIKIEDVDVSKENAKNNEMTSEALNNSQVPKTTEMQLQYKYKPEQWSPVNPEGKMMYDREFLLQLLCTGRHSYRVTCACGGWSGSDLALPGPSDNNNRSTNNTSKDKAHIRLYGDSRVKYFERFLTDNEVDFCCIYQSGAKIEDILQLVQQNLPDENVGFPIVKLAVGINNLTTFEGNRNLVFSGVSAGRILDSLSKLKSEVKGLLPSALVGIVTIPPVIFHKYNKSTSDSDREQQTQFDQVLSEVNAGIKQLNNATQLNHARGCYTVSWHSHVIKSSRKKRRNGTHRWVNRNDAKHLPDGLHFDVDLKRVLQRVLIDVCKKECAYSVRELDSRKDSEDSESEGEDRESWDFKRVKRTV